MKNSLFLFLALLVFGGTASAQQVDEGGPADAAAPQPAAGEAVDASGVGNENVTSDYFTGAATTRIPIELPEGRRQMTPRLALVYNSHRHREDGHTGKGWELTVSHIARMHKYGTPDYDGGEFVLHEEGEDVQLIRLEERINDCQLYRFKVEGTDQRRFFRCDGYWVMYDKKGVRHYFGLGEAKLQSDWNVYRWYLSKSEDLNGNAVLYRYEPENWRYEGETMTTLRLQSIEYTRFEGNEEGLYRVELGYTPREHNRFQFRPAFGLLYGSLLSEIRVLFQDGSPIRRYQLNYTGTNGASYLSQVAQSAGSEQDAREEYALQTLPPINFEYGDEGIERLWRGRAYRFADPFGEALRLNGEYHLLDMNGDGRLDRVWSGTPRDELRNDIRVHYGTGFGFSANATEWNDICNGYCFPRHLHFLDMNGDGLADRILATNGMLYIRYNNGRRFRWGENIPDPFCAGDSPHPEACDRFQMLDMNGDGLPDRVDYDPTRLRTFVYINHGHRFSTVPEVWEIRRAEVEEGHLRRLIDMNGDNLPDLVVPSSAFRNMASGFLAIYWNHGHGWSGLPVWWQDPGIDAELNNPHFSWLTDVNNDRLPDRILGGGLSGAVGFMRIHLNNGTGLDPDGIMLRDPSSWNNWGFLRYDNGGQLVPGILDLNGDGTPERVTVSGDDYIAYATSFRIPNRNYDQPPGLLSQVDNGIGVRRQLGYTSTLEIQNRLMPFHLYCLGSVRLQEGEETQDTYIDYAGGQFYSDWYNVVGRKFNGFQFVRVRDPLNGVEETWYHQARDVIAGNLFVAREHIPPLGDGSPIPVDPVDSENDPAHETYWGDVALSGKPAKVVTLIRKPGINGLEKFKEIRNAWTLFGRFARLDNVQEETYDSQLRAVRKTTGYVYDNDSGNIFSVIEESDAGNPGIKKRAFNYRSYSTPYGDFPSSRVTEIAWRSPQNTPLKRIVGEYDRRLNLLRQAEDIYYLGAPSRREHRYFDYDPYGNPGGLTQPNGTVVTYGYDEGLHAYPARIVVNGEFVTKARTDLRFGKKTFEQTPDGRRLETRHDALGRPLDKKFQGRWEEKFAYFDPVPRGDGERFLSVVHRFDHVEGDPAADRLPREVFIRDGQGRLIQRGTRSERSDNRYRMERTVYLRDISQNTERASEPFFAAGPEFSENGGARFTETRMDGLGRVHRITPPPGDPGSPTGPTVTAYGVEGNPLAVMLTDPSRRATRTTRDIWGNVIRVDEIAGGAAQTTRYEYNTFNNLERILPARGEPVVFAHDSAGRRRRMTDPVMGTWEFQYDAMDNLVESLDAAENVVRSLYDPHNRLTEQFVIPSGGGEEDHIRYFYDAADEAGFRVRTGELFKVTDPSGSILFGYDDRGNIEKTARRLDGLEGTWTTESIYRADSRLETLQYPSELLRLRYRYDTSGKLSRIQNGETGEEYYAVDPDRGYDPFGNLLKESFGNGLEDTRDYFANSHRLMGARTRTTDRPAVLLRRLGYGYDAAGNITEIADRQNSPELNTGLGAVRYDDLHRILGYSRGNNWETRERTEYRYDAIGNILRNDESFAGRDYVYQGQKLLRIGEDEPFQYNASGSMTAGRGRTFAYNGRNQLEAITLQNGMRVDYRYDYSGKRAVKTVQREGLPSENNFLIGTHFEIKNNLWIHHVYAGNRRIAALAMERPDNPGPAPEAGDFVFRVDVEDDWPRPDKGYFYYLHADHLGSPNLFTEGRERATHDGLRYQKGDLVQRVEHHPFGRERFIFHPSLEELPRYTGQVYDMESDLYYYQSRYYDPVLGRFIQPDTVIPNPYNPQSLNRYAYVLNNPLKYADPSGHWPTGIHNEIIDAAFPHLSGELRDAIKGGSRRVDDDQSRETSFRHAMRFPGQTVEDARDRMDNFIHERVDAYRQQSRSGQLLEAGESLGEALHPMMDSTSPAHEGFQVWRGLAHPVDALKHALEEKNISEEQFEETVGIIREFADKLQPEENSSGDDHERSGGEIPSWAD